jgi:hypothetical protein
MIQLNQNQSLEKQIYEKNYHERKRYGDRAEDCFNEYLKSKYNQSEITYRQKEKEVDFKLPDFAIKPVGKDHIEFEVKTTNKIKYRDFAYQIDYAEKLKIKVYYVYVNNIENRLITFRPIEIRTLLDYRLLAQDGVYDDSIPKAYFKVDWNFEFGFDHEVGWQEFYLPQGFVIS